MSEADTRSAVSDPAPILTETRRLFLDRLVDIVSPAGGFPAPAQEAVRRGSGRFFDEITTNKTRAGFEQARGLTASKITLVDDNQLELSIRLGEVTRRLTDVCAVPLAKLFPRFVTLLDRPDMEADENPVGPEAVCAGIGEAFGELGLKVGQSLERLIAIEATLAQELPLLYARLNELLVNRQVQPARVRAPGGDGRRTSTQASRPDPIAVLQRTIMGRMPATAATPGPAAASGFASGATVSAQTTDPAALAFNTSRMQQLVGMLQERQLASSSAIEESPNALQALKTSDFGTMVRGQEAATLDTLALLFQAIFDDPDLADAVKSSIGRLQIPLLKAAMIDSSLFADRTHPARVLLDTMAGAAAGLGADTDGDHPVCVELKRVAIAVQTEFQQDIGVFARHAAELDTFTASQHLELQRSAHNYIAAAQRQEAFDLAEIDATHALQAADLGSAPPVIADFLRQHWKKALVAAHIDHGEDSEAWHVGRAVLSDLLWSLEPRSDPEERKRLAIMVPTLLQRLRAGLDRAGVPAEVRAPFFDACFILQAAALRGKTAASIPGGVEASMAGYDRSDTVGTAELELNGTKLRSLRLAKPTGTEDSERVARLALGDWVEFEIAPGERANGQLTWISPALGNPLFTNPAWNHAISIQRPILERQLAHGQAKVAGEESLFDSAAEKALRTMVTR